MHRSAGSLRDSRAESSLVKTSQSLYILIPLLLIIHRSVGEPAEGSLPRFHVSTHRALFSFSPPAPAGPPGCTLVSTEYLVEMLRPLLTPFTPFLLVDFEK